MTRLRMRVKGMTCPTCEAHVTKALEAAGATDVDADFRRGEATFVVTGAIDQARLRTAIEATGYTPGAVEPVDLGDGALRTYRLPIDGMTCTDCEHHVVQALREAGAPRAEADFRRGEARFAAPVAVPPTLFEEAIRDRTRYRPGRAESTEIRTDIRLPRASRDASYDLAIVGSGGGAFAAAIAATEQGARVVMVERGTLGGTCVNVGCVPSKTQLRAGELLWQAGHHPFAGIQTRAESVDLATLVDQKDALVASLRQHKYADLIDAYGWELVRGEARFEDERTLRVGERAIRAEAFLLATGARPAVPVIPGLDAVDYLTSTTLLDLRERPEHLLVIGAGYIGLELGQLFHHLGSRVTLLQRGARLLHGYDPEIGEAMRAILEAEGIEVITGATFLRAEQDGGTKRLRVRLGDAERTFEGDALLVAAGRTPNTEALDLPTAGVERGSRGEILVDELLRTSNPRVFAAGDVTLGPQYVYVAAHQGAVAAENALGGHRAVDLRAVPGVTFTTPSIATVGLTEAQARAAGHEVKASVLTLENVPRALVNHDTRGLFKVVADARTDEVLGVHVLAENAGEVISAGVLAVRFHLTVKDLADTFVPYLTMSEGLKLAAQSFSRDPAKLSCCAA